MEIKTGDEHFIYDGMPAGFILDDFWRWQASDLLSNTLRGVLAEFIVAKALKIETSHPRVEWDAYDLLFHNRECIEVKASAYVQSWDQKKKTAVRFSIRPTKTWEGETGFSDDVDRRSHMYIFCFLAECDREKVNPLLLDQWEFYPVLTSEINEKLGDQQSISLTTLKSLCPEAFDFISLRDAAIWLLSGRSDSDARRRIDEHNALKRARKEIG